MIQKKESNNSLEKKSSGIKNAIAIIEKQYGKGAIMMLDNNMYSPEVEVISTGILSLDLALGVMGLPKGRIVEIFGPEASGKTTLALKALIECQKQGGSVAFIDAEHALDIKYLQHLGGRSKNLLISQPNSGEEALEITDILLKSGIDMVVIDSVASLVPQSEIEGEIGNLQIGAQARLMSQALRKLTASVQKNQAIIIFINQLRMKIGTLFGNPETTSGGNALKFYASIRLDIRRGSNIKNNDGQYIGHLIKIKVVKNKVAIPHKSAEFELIYENPQISALRDLLNLACDLSIVQCYSGWYSINDTKLGHGKEKAIDFLKTQENLVLDIKNKILNVVKSEDRFNIAVK